MTEWMRCSKCGKEKPAMMFRRHVTDGYYDACKTCRNSIRRRKAQEAIDMTRGIVVQSDVNGSNVVRGVYIAKGIVQVEAKTTACKWGWLCTMIRSRGGWEVVQADERVFETAPKVGSRFDTVSEAEAVIASILGYEVSEAE